MDWDLKELPEPNAEFDWSSVPYRLVGALGQGAMGHVYRAFDERLGREVAVKLTRLPAHAEAQRARFLREGELAASLRHANLVTVHDVFAQGPFLALVYQLVEGARSLDQAWGAVLGERISLLRQAAEGIAHAHEQGVVHRDLKPDNVLVDANGHVQVTDFGVAFNQKLDRLTQTGVAVGTPMFMAPEQFFRSGDPTPATDVWSLGVLLYLAIADTLPFPGPTLVALGAQAQAGATRQVLAPLGHAPAPLVALVHDSLQPERESRPANARAFCDALDGWRRAQTKLTPGRRLVALAYVLAVAAVGIHIAIISLAAEAPPAASAPPTPSPSSSVAPLSEVGRLVRRLEGRGPSAALAALELHRRGSHTELARPHLARLRRQPLAILEQELRRGFKKDWEVGFVPGDPYSIVGMADHTGEVTRWNLLGGPPLQTARSEFNWTAAVVTVHGGVASGEVRGLHWVSLDGSATTRIVPETEEARLEGAVASSGAIWVIGRGSMVRVAADGKRVLKRYRTPLLGTPNTLAASGESELIAGISVASSDESHAYRFDIPAERWELLGRFPGQDPRVGAHANTRSAAVATDRGLLVVVGADRSVDTLSPVGVQRELTRFLHFTPGGTHLWRVFEGEAEPKNRLELYSLKTHRLRATWKLRERPGDSRLSPCGRFLALGLRTLRRDDSRAVEIWYVGPEVWDVGG